MKRSNEKKKKKTKSLITEGSLTFKMLYYWGKFIGINPLSLSVKNELKFSYVTLLYGCVLGLFYCCVGVRAIYERLQTVYLLTGDTPIAVIADFMRIGLQCIDSSLPWLIFAINQNRIKLIINSFIKIERTSRKLGIPENYEKRFGEFGRHLIVHNLLCFASMLLSELMWLRFMKFPRLTWRIFNFLTIGSFNSFMLFVWSLSLVKHKLTQLNRKAQNIIRNKNINVQQMVEEASQIIRNIRCDSELEPGTINKLSQLHQDLRNIIHHIEKHCSPIILINTATNFSFITISMYRLYHHIEERNSFGVLTICYLGAVSHLAFYPVGMLIMISNICGSTADEANSTGNLIHSIMNNCYNIGDSRFTEELKLFSLDLLQNRVSMSVFGLFKLDYFLVYSIAVSVINYLVLMLQL